MTKMQLHAGSGGNLPCYASTVLGTGDVTPMTLASSYAILANNGKYCPPNPILSITTPDKKPLKLGPAPASRSSTPTSPRARPSCSQGVIKGGTGHGRARFATGSGQDRHHRQARRVVVRRLHRPARGRRLGRDALLPAGDERHLARRQSYGGVFGGDIAAPIWKDLIQNASVGLPNRDFDDPSSKIINGDRIAVPFVGGMSVEEATARLKEAGFLAQVAGQANSGYARGTVVYTNPSGTALRGSTIGLYTSSGVNPPTTPDPTKTPNPKPTKTKPPGRR